MDGALPVRLREVNLGYGGNSLEGQRDVQQLPKVSELRHTQLAYNLSEDAE